ncbi:MAG: NAD(P)H-hydrate epimerase [Nanoarchaeota archaeon]
MITSEQMKQLEDKSEQLGVSRSQLMENAGKGIYDSVKERFSDLRDKKILIVAYHGNNGGDGFVAADYLSSECEVDVLFIGDETKFKKEADVNFRKIEKNDLIQILVEPEQLDFDDYDIIIDALLGTGVVGEIKEPISFVIDMINKSDAFKIAVDIPSGIDPDTGEGNKFVDADMVITFHDIKSGLEKFKDKTVILDIGIPGELI